MLREWLRAHDVLLAYRQINILEDIDVVGRKIGRNRPIFVHFSCHGDVKKEEYHPHRPFIRIAPGIDIYLDDEKTIDVVARRFSPLPVLFSACLLGRYQTKMTDFGL
jgi:hypothetical protein